MTALRITRGDRARLAVAATLADGVTPQPLTGLTVRFMAKDRLNDADNLAVISLDSAGVGGITIDNAAGGLATVTIPAASTSAFARRRRLYWDVQASSGATDPITLDSGTLDVLPDVVRTA